jgi:hypothetical protein
MRTRSGSRYSNGGEVVALVGQKRKRSALAVAGECACGGRRKRLAGGPDYLDALPDDLVLSILTKLAASSSAPSDLLSVHLTYVRPLILRFVINFLCSIRRRTQPLPRAIPGMRGGVGAVLQFTETLGNG